MSEFVGYIDQGMEFVVGWLQNYMLHCPTLDAGHDGYTIAGKWARANHEAQIGGACIVEILAELAREQPTDIHPLAPLVYVRLIPLGAERTEINITCYDLFAQRLYEHLCEEMEKRWPELESGQEGVVQDATESQLRLADQPWNLIKDHLWHRSAVELWWRGYSASEIEDAVGPRSHTIENNISELRRIYGHQIIPYHSKRPKRRRNREFWDIDSGNPDAVDYN